MKKIININLASRLIPIEDSAYELLKTYIDSLKAHFSHEEGGEEIVGDIEDRIAELFQEKLKKGAHCITDDDVNAMILTMGKPEQLEEETAAEPQEKTGSAQNNPHSGGVPPAPKRFTRNANDKVLGGVCSGIAAYFGIDPVIVRIITFLLFCVAGSGILIYIVLWIVLPSQNLIPGQPLQNVSKKRLYRDRDKKVIGGVASGLAAYWNIDPVIPRIIFVLPLLGIIFSSIFHHVFWFPGFFFPLSLGSLPTLILLYFVLWITVPYATTVTEKLEMRGEKVDLQSITNAMKGTQEEKKSESGNESSPENKAEITGSGTANLVQAPAPAYIPPKKHSGIGEVFILFLKIFMYFVLGIIVIGICVALVSIAGGFIGTAAFSSMMFPFKGLLLSSSLQKFLAWPGVFLTLGIPVVAIIWLFIKLITGFKPRNRNVGVSLLLLWIIGVICAVWLFFSVGSDFRMNYRESTNILIQQPPKGHLLISLAPSPVSVSGWTVFGNFIQAGEDTVILRTVNLDILKSTDDSFHAVIIRASNGHSYEQARNYARNISFTVTQQDSVFYIPNGFSIPKGIPFRNQRAILRVSVPIGKYVRIDDNLRGLNLRSHWRLGFSNGSWNYDNYDYSDWDYDEEYIMTKDGLKSLDDTNHNNQDNNIPSASDSSKPKPYRYHGPSAGSDSDDGNSASLDPAIKTMFFNV